MPVRRIKVSESSNAIKTLFLQAKSQLECENPFSLPSFIETLTHLSSQIQPCRNLQLLYLSGLIAGGIYEVLQSEAMIPLRYLPNYKKFLMDLVIQHTNNKGLPETSLLFTIRNLIEKDLENLKNLHLLRERFDIAITKYSKVKEFINSIEFDTILFMLRNVERDPLERNISDLLISHSKPYLPPEIKLNTLVVDLEIFGNFTDEKFEIRPGCWQFIQFLSNVYEIVLFTLKENEFVTRVMDLVDPRLLVKYRLGRSHSVSSEKGLLKDLSVLGRDLSRVVVTGIDLENFLTIPKNSVVISKWTGNYQDSELFRLQGVLSFLALRPYFNSSIFLKIGKRT